MVKLAVISAQYVFPDTPDFIGGLRSCRWVASVLKMCYPCGGIIVFQSLISLGQRVPEILRGTSPRLQEISWEVFYLHSCFVFLKRKSSPRDLFPYLRRDFFGIRLTINSV